MAEFGVMARSRSAVGRMGLSRLALLTLALASCARQAQQPLQWLSVPWTTRDVATQFGAAVASVGDLDGDGWTEVAVGEPKRSLDANHTGCVWIYSTKTLSAVRALTGPVADAACEFGWSLASGSVGGRPCLLVGAPAKRTGGGYVALFELQSDKQPVVATASAVGEGFGHDVAAARTNESALVCAWAISGSFGVDVGVRQLSPDLSTVQSLAVHREFTAGCLELDGTGDIDGDGTPDLLVGDATGYSSDFEETGAVCIYACGSNELVASKSGNYRDETGQQVAYLGDIDGDGADDFAMTCSQLGHGNGYVAIVSGRARRELRRIVSNEQEMLGWTALARTPDLDGDGHDDILADARRASDTTYVVKALSSRTGDVLFEASSDVFPGAIGPFAVVRISAQELAIARGLPGDGDVGRLELIRLPDAR